MQTFELYEFLTRSHSQETINNHPIFMFLSKHFYRMDFVGGPRVAGGALRSLIMNEKQDTDIDIFFSNEHQLENFFNNIMAEWEQTGEVSVSETDTVTTLIDPSTKMKVQLIHLFHQTPEAVIDSFDFTITQFITDGEVLMCGDFALWDLARKRLVLNRLTYGVSTIRRAIKYTKKGYYICGGTISKSWSQLRKTLLL